jgi:hypothetical protein
MRFWLPLAMALALLHSASALTHVNWKLQWCGPNTALFQWGTDTYFTSNVLRWDPAPTVNSWKILSYCDKPHAAIFFQPKSTASGSLTFGFSTHEDSANNYQIQGCTWKNIGKKGLDPKIPCSSGWSACQGGYATNQQLPYYYQPGGCP